MTKGVQQWRDKWFGARPFQFDTECYLGILGLILLVSPLQGGVVATVHPLASRAAMNAMEKGGNAVDAAVAAGLTLGVVDGFNSGIGGGCFMLIHRANGQVIAIDGRETAPAKATPEMYQRDGQAMTSLSQKGALASGVPGALKAYAHANQSYGRLSLKELILPAAEIAAQGFVIDEGYYRRASSVAKALSDYPSSAAVFLVDEGKVPSPGNTLIQADLANTYRSIAEYGADWFYQRDFADSLDKWMRLNDGVMRREDLVLYKIKAREPVRTSYRGYDIVGFPPPSSGGVHTAQILNILENFDLSSLDPNGVDWIQIVVEAMKRAFADRAFWLGDPDFVDVPKGLIDKEYAKRLASEITPGRSSSVEKYQIPPDADERLFEKHTTHFSVADEEGNWVACTATVNTTYGSKVVIPGTGVVMNNEMDDFALQPGVPNAFGLLGSEANSVEAGKRPLSSMSPTIVLKDGKPLFSVGAAGGPTIISQTVLAIIRVIDFGMSIEDSLAAPRFHHQWRPDRIVIEEKFPAAVFTRLESMGYSLSKTKGIGVSQAVAQDAQGKFHGAADPRANGLAIAE
jgi:gamma-glutamyltranspeptidase/glutathione hydrolase